METLLAFAEKNILFSALLIFMFFDVCSGLAAAAVQKKLSSPISYAGMSRKFMIIIMVFTAHIMDWIGMKVTPTQPPLAGLVMIFFNVRELISITENAVLCGVPVPAFFKDRLAVMQQSVDMGKVIAIAGGFLQTAPADPHTVAGIGALSQAPGTTTTTTTSSTISTTVAGEDGEKKWPLA